jgi:DNA repair/transcription protein MET18/MMS19
MKDPADADFVRQITNGLLDSIFRSTLGSQGFDHATGGKLQVVFWIAKALLMRGDHYGMEITEKVAQLLGNRTFGPAASRGFAILLGEDEFLTKDNYAIVRPLMKQKVFSFCLPKIVDGFRNAGPGRYGH